MAKVNRVGRSFSTLPFDGIDNVANISFHDDFIDATASNWTTVQAVGDSAGTTAEVDATAGHVGVISLSTGATTPAAGDTAALVLGDADAGDKLVLDPQGVYVATLLNIPDIDATNVEFGLLGQAAAAPNSSAANLVSFVYEEADFGAGTWAAQVNSAGTDVEEEFTLTYVQSDWVLLELYATDSDAFFKLTTEDGNETINLTPVAMPTVALVPAYAVEAVGAAEETIEIDTFHMRMERAPIQANVDAVNWLGA